MSAKLFTILFCACVPGALIAQCNLPAAALDQFHRLQTHQMAFDAYLFEGLTYLDIGCLTESRRAFEIAKEAGNKSQQSLALQYLDLAEARIAWQDGRLPEARERMLSLASATRPGQIGFRAVLMLSDMLAQPEQHDADTWAKFKPELKLCWEKTSFWKARLDQAILAAVFEPSGQAISDLQKELEEDLDVQKRLALEVILIDALKRSNRLTEAKLMAASIENEFGEKALDHSLRVYFLQVSVGIWSTLSSRGEPNAQGRLNVYNEALARVNASP